MVIKCRALKKFIDELDESIEQELSGIDIFSLPVDFQDDNFEIVPIFQTYVLRIMIVDSQF